MSWPLQAVLHSSDPIAPVGYLQPTRFHIEPKQQQQQQQDETTQEAGNGITSNSSNSGADQGLVSDVREVPADWEPSSAYTPMLHRSSLDYKPGAYDVKVMMRRGPDYMQVGWWHGKGEVGRGGRGIGTGQGPCRMSGHLGHCSFWQLLSEGSHVDFWYGPGAAPTFTQFSAL